MFENILPSDPHDSPINAALPFCTSGAGGDRNKWCRDLVGWDAGLNDLSEDTTPFVYVAVNGNSSPRFVPPPDDEV